MEKILKKLKKLLRLIFGRTTLGTLFLLIQILVLFAGFDWFREYLIYMYGGSAMLSALVLIYIISDEGNSTIKLSWVVPILIFPVFGTLFYLFLTLQPGTRRINRRIEEVGTNTSCCTFYRIRRCWHTMRASAPAAAISSAI